MGKLSHLTKQTLCDTCGATMQANAYATHSLEQSGNADAKTLNHCDDCLEKEKEKEQNKLTKILHQIEDLKQRVSGGAQLEKTQLAKIEREPEVLAALAKLDGGEALHFIRDQVEKKRKRETSQASAMSGSGVSFQQHYAKDHLTHTEIRAAKKQRKGMTHEKRLETKREQRLKEEEEANPKAPGEAPNDWICVSCGNQNYASREHCNMRRCQEPRPLREGEAMEAVPTRGLGTKQSRAEKEAGGDAALAKKIAQFASVAQVRV